MSDLFSLKMMWPSCSAARVFSVAEWPMLLPRPEPRSPLSAATPNAATNAWTPSRKPAARAIFQAADATSRDGLLAARDAIEKQLGPTSILINATGGNRPDATLPPGADFCKLPIEAWQGVFDLNLVAGVLLPSQVFGESMLRAGRGSIINIASMSA